MSLQEEDLEKFEEYYDAYTTNREHPLKIIMSFYKGYKIKMIRACIFLLFQRSPVWVIPVVTANVINTATHPGDNSFSRIVWNVVIASVFLLQNILSSYLATIEYAKVNRGIEGSLRNAQIKKLHRLSMMFHQETQAGRLQSKIMRDVENVQDLLSQIFRTLFFFLLDITIAIAVTLYRSPMVFLFFIIVVPISILTLHYFRKPISERNNEFRKEVEHTQGAVAEMLEMIPVTRAHGLQDLEVKKMNSHLSQIAERGFHLDLINSLFGATSWVLFQGFQILCLAFTGYLAYQGKINVGDMVLYMTYFSQIVGQISTIINIYPNVSRGLESVKSIGDILLDSNVEQNNSIIPLDNLKGQVEFCNVDFRYRSEERWILKDFSLKVNSGESIAFVGESGAGKSTIINLLIGFVRPENGKILIDRINMSNLNMNEYRSQIAVVPQKTILFSGTIRENISYGLEGVSDQEIARVIEEVGLDDLIEKLPGGLDSQMGEHGDKLSGGQKQRISVARALIRNPKIIIFDEATSALDSSSEKKVQEATNHMMKNYTTFLVAHRLSTIKKADRIAVVKDGTIIEIGSYQDLMEKKGAFYALKSLQD